MPSLLRQAVKNNYLSVVESLPKSTYLMVVTKTRSIDDIIFLYECGHRYFGENRVTELIEKDQALVENRFDQLRWCFIGNLQSNKVKALVEKVDRLESIHSIDSLKLLKKLVQVIPGRKNPEPLRVFLQVKTSFEDEKAGFTDIDQVYEAIRVLQDEPQLVFAGLMTMSPIRTKEFEKEARKSFAQLQHMAGEISNKHDVSVELSMGMTSDYKIALEYQTHWVRIGSKIFA